MFLLPYVITIGYGLFQYFFQNKGKKKIFWIWCGILLCLMSNTTSALNYADFINYDSMFKICNSGLSFSEVSNQFGITFWGWYLLCKIFYNLGLNYRGMQIFVIFLSMFLLHRANIKNSVKSEDIFWGLFLLFPAVLSIIQVRFFLASSIIFCGYTFLTNANYSKLKRFILYSLSVLLAASIHSSCYLFIILSIVLFIKNNNIKKSLTIALSSLFILVTIYRFVPYIAAKLISKDKIERYFYSGNQTNEIVLIIIFVLTWAIIVGISSLCINRSYQIQNKQRLLEYFNSLSILGSTVILMLYDSSFYRYIQIALLFGYLIISNYFQKNDNNSLLKTLSMIILSLLLIIIVFLVTSNDQLIPIFRFNNFNSILRATV